MPSTQHEEREAISESFAALGPAAPTILPGWDAADLLQHLLVRERYPHLSVGSKLPGLLGRRATGALEELRATDWHELVELLREGPGVLSPVRTVDAFSGQGELLIHHEDLRRAQDGWEPRRLSAETDAQAWRAVSLLSRVSLHVNADITVVSPLGGRLLRSRRSAGSLRVHGEPLELLLWASGRDEVARVRIHGEASALQALSEGRRRL